MKLYYYLVAIFIACQLPWTKASKMVCYYDTTGAVREGPAKFTPKDMETALQFCSYVIYSYNVIAPKTVVDSSLLQRQQQEFLNVAKIKTKFPNVKFLFSLSGHKDLADTGSFLKFLEADHKAQNTFVTSVVEILRKYKFDGLSLDLPLPTEKPKRVQSYYAAIVSGIKNLFASNSPEDAKASEHKKQLTDLIAQLSAALKVHNLMLSLTVMPNVKSKSYFDTKSIIKNLDFVILSAFDFYTPERNPEIADYVAPIHAPIKTGNRLPQANVDQLVEEWLKTLKVPAQKLIVGIPAYGRSWKMSNESKPSGLPPVSFTQGPGPAGNQTHLPGFLSWPEVCVQIPKASSKVNTLVTALRSVIDPTKKYGNYAYRAADKNGNAGLWISYEDPSTVAAKAEYAKHHNLGGVALFDITLDDLRGRCNGDTFPMLRSIVAKLLQ
ncbi:chitinase-like protein Idgf3 [Calliphora vicina]|uniref:chitinase-like protein Idgf3 n=1 Tax=Calliphora vicina TaxID=7373 RepID=UPI00325BE1E0